MGRRRLLFPMRVVDEVTQTVQQHADEKFIVGYRFSPEEPESPGISMEITEQLVKALVEKPLDYLHASLMDIESPTREGKYKDIQRVELLHKWIDGKMPLIGIGSIFTAEDALKAIQSGNVELIALGREILLDYRFVEKIKDGRTDEIISQYDPEREDRHNLPPKLSKQFDDGFYPLPRTDGK